MRVISSFMEDPIVVNSYNNIINVQDDSLLINTINSAKGRARLAQSMVAPLRTRLDYQSIGRKIFMVEQLPAGALPIYDKDINVCSVLQGSKSEPVTIKKSVYPDDEIIVSSNNDILDKQGGHRVVIPQFQIYSNPTIKISDVKQRRFNLIDRSVQHARSQIMAQEDSSIFEALDKIGKSEYISYEPPLDKETNMSYFSKDPMGKGIQIFGIVMFAVVLVLAGISIYGQMAH